jgi:ACS family hexuronate transporter-like MFS transporter
MLVCAVLTITVIYASVATDKWLATILIALACSTNQGLSTNLFTLVSDMFSKNVVGTVVGVGEAAHPVNERFVGIIWHLGCPRDIEVGVIVVVVLAD